MRRFWTTFLYTLGSFRGQILGWGLGIASLGLMVVAYYGVFSSGKSDFAQMIENYPSEFLAFFGGDANTILTPEGFVGMYAFSMLPLILGIFVLAAGSLLIVGDEERGRLDLILSHPVGRNAFFFARLSAFGCALLGILLVSWLGFCVLLDSSTMDITWGRMVLPFLSLMAQGLVYGMLALLLSLLLPSRSLSATITGLVLVTSYFLSSMAFMDEKLQTIAKFLPHAYYQGTTAFHDFNLTWFFSLLGICAGMALWAWRLFVRRDIRLSGEGSWKLPAFSRRN